MEETWTYWLPVGRLSGFYGTQNIIQKGQSLKIVLANYKTENHPRNLQHIGIEFDMPIAYQVVPDSYSFPIEYEISNEEYKKFENVRGYGAFLKSTNSSYIMSLLQNNDFSGEKQLIHYVIINLKDTIDVLSFEEPTVTFLS